MPERLVQFTKCNLESVQQQAPTSRGHGSGVSRELDANVSSVSLKDVAYLAPRQQEHDVRRGGVAVRRAVPLIWFGEEQQVVEYLGAAFTEQLPPRPPSSLRSPRQRGAEF